MADDRTKRILKQRRTARVGGTVALGGIVGGFIGWVFDWKPVAFLLNRFQDLQSLAESVGLSTPQEGTPEYYLLELASAPVTGILLGLTFVAFPWARAWLDRRFPDPPSFLRSDLTAECTRIMALDEAPLTMFVERDAEQAARASFALRSDASFLWRALIGPTGVGKSRLAIEWLRSLRNAGWDVGVATPEAPVPDEWRPRRPTAIVFDDAGRQWTGALPPTLHRLAKAAGPKAPIRTLIVDVIEPNTASTPEGALRETIRAARADSPLMLSGPQARGL